jgi:hypothetical protein
MTREAGEARRRQTDVQAAIDAASARADEATAALDAARAGARRADEERLAAMAAVEHLIGERERVAADLALVAAIEEEPVPEAKQGSDIAALQASAREAREAREVAEAERDAARSAWEAAVRVADEDDALATDRRAAVARHAERTEQLQRAVVRIGRERAVIGESIRAAPRPWLRPGMPNRRRGSAGPPPTRPGSRRGRRSLTLNVGSAGEPGGWRSSTANSSRSWPT